MPGKFASDDIVTALKAAAEPTRLRILMLLMAGELSVKDLTVILGQSQPRISRHLKLLAEAGLVERFREGSWAYFHVSDRSAGGKLAMDILSLVDPDDRGMARDRERAEALKREREASAQSYFQAHAADWDRIRALHVAERDVEAAIADALGAGPFSLLVDLGTGTGRVLELLSDRYDRGIGFDVNNAMLAYARSKLSGISLGRAQVRHGDLYALNLADGAADAVVMHQVLHFLSDPLQAIREAARVLAPGGRLLIVDFAPHDLEFLRDEYAHDRLGFPAGQVAAWMRDAGLSPQKQLDLAPTAAAGPEALTVSLWLAVRPPETNTKTTEKTARAARALEGAP
ncbi:Transcriptional regulator, ArsR family [Hyphomicrobium sulfonivorans]|uniref:Transcriptional regulator, ArsR family n=1 Tax=Hyphomicrobium sulfonivorans TaxID=121290 RepID=A0A109BDJ7_HYPSL|nr:metalloregulator ArsR/SmtB family transcription factor [Hyphomicrobium sulfonivorans]KWT66813.1 Transcriptional regulator, ArsR family [Hyphomicrobium sulfonivorans]